MKKASNYELSYHIRPPEGLLNDPNGLTYFKGYYHVFYQWNPSGLEHKNKVWGHVIGQDLVHWERQPTALEPSEWYDKDGIYSGGAIVHGDSMYLFYTGNVIKTDDVRESYQCLAVSEDGLVFEKKGPLFRHPKGYTRHVRDPKVWKDARGQWNLIVGAQHENQYGDALLYQSADLYNWELKGEFIENKETFGYMWECPDYVQFDESDVFIFSPQGLEPKGEEFKNLNQSGYIIGQTDLEGKFSGKVADFKEFDRGFDFYAPQTFVHDERVFQFGWMSSMDSDQEKFCPTVQEGWLHALTIPRELTLKDGKLYQQPVKELNKLRNGAPINLPLKEECAFELPSLSAELIVDFEQATADVAIDIRDSIRIEYQLLSGKLSVQRKNWADGSLESRQAALKRPLRKLHLFLDGSSLEMFVNDGEEVFSLRFFCEEPAERTVKITSEQKNVSIQLFLMEHIGLQQ